MRAQLALVPPLSFGMARRVSGARACAQVGSLPKRICIAAELLRCLVLQFAKMLIFHANLGPNMGGPNWYIGPLIMLLPFLLGSGILSVPLNLLSLLVSRVQLGQCAGRPMPLLLGLYPATVAALGAAGERSAHHNIVRMGPQYWLASSTEPDCPRSPELAHLCGPPGAHVPLVGGAGCPGELLPLLRPR